MNFWQQQGRMCMATTAAGASGGSGSGGTATGAAGATPPDTSSAGGGTSGQEWFSSLPAEEKGFIQTKGYKDLAEAVKSHRNLESLLGAPKERLLKLPEKADDKAGWESIYNKLGRPEKADGYDPKTFGDGTSESDAKWLQETFHSLNLTKAQGEQLAGKWHEKMKGLRAAMDEAKESASNQQLEKLKQDWGGAFEEKTSVANKVAEQMGIDEKSYQKGEEAFGVDGWAKMLSGFAEKFGIKFGEAGFHRGDGPNIAGKATREQAKEELNRLMSDREFGKRLAAGDAQTVAKWHEINRALASDG